MILTGKAKEDFIDYLWQSKFKKDDYKEYEDYIDNQKESHTYADIIEWFDSVGIYIEIQIHQILRGVNMWRGKVNNCVYDDLEYKSNRQQATKEAIKKANQIYNDR